MNGACRPIFEKLVDGATGTPGASGGAPIGGALIDDPEVARHVSSCLDCFRVLTELREVPRIAEVLRREIAIPGPGPAFWDALAARTVDAVAAATPTASTASAEDPARDPHPPAIVIAPRPWRAALVGAAAAAASLFWIFFGHPPADHRSPWAPPAATALGQAPPAGAELERGELERGELERGELERGEVIESEDETDGVAADMATDVATMDAPEMVEQIAGLDGPALRRLAQSLLRSAL